MIIHYNKDFFLNGFSSTCISPEKTKLYPAGTKLGRSENDLQSFVLSL